MDGTYMTNGELAAMQAKSSLTERIKKLEERVARLELRNRPLRTSNPYDLNAGPRLRKG